jgi:hypothetical protein
MDLATALMVGISLFARGLELGPFQVAGIIRRHKTDQDATCFRHIDQVGLDRLARPLRRVPDAYMKA